MLQKSTTTCANDMKLLHFVAEIDYSLVLAYVFGIQRDKEQVGVVIFDDVIFVLVTS